MLLALAACVGFMVATANCASPPKATNVSVADAALGSSLDGQVFDGGGAYDGGRNGMDGGADGVSSSKCPAPLGTLAPTPPMGWNSWTRFTCDMNEDVIKGIADAMVTSGMQAAGYQYVILDDCWQGFRAADGSITADATKFKSGIKSLADYVHAKGLKLGLYTARGTATCHNRPGSGGREKQDAVTYAAWGVDYVKEDNCNADATTKEAQYRLMRTELTNATVGGRSIVFGISAWPFAPWMPQVGQLWRTTEDIQDRWEIASYGVLNLTDLNTTFADSAGPGHWNDPDVLEVGNGGMTDAEYRSHFSLWAMMAAPLIASNDLRTMAAATKTILTNSDVIAVDQDPLGVQGKPISTKDGLQIWSKKLCGDQTVAVLLLNRSLKPADITVTWKDLGLTSTSAKVRDLWSHTDLGATANQYTARSIVSHGMVMLKVVGE
jgi:alpha-galactosidase